MKKKQKISNKKAFDKFQIKEIQIASKTDSTESRSPLISYQQEIQSIINKNIKKDVATCIFKPRQIGATTYIIQASKKLLSEGKRVAIVTCNEHMRSCLEETVLASECKHKYESGDLALVSTTNKLVGKNYFDYIFLDEVAHKYTSSELINLFDVCKRGVGKLSGIIIITTSNPNNCYFFRYILQELKYNRISIAWLDKRDNQEMKKHLSDSQYNIEYLNELI